MFYFHAENYLIQVLIRKSRYPETIYGLCEQKRAIPNKIIENSKYHQYCAVIITVFNRLIDRLDMAEEKNQGTGR